MPMFVPDDTLTAPLEVIKHRLDFPGKNLYNVFLKNTNIHLRPNFHTENYPVFSVKEIVIVNSVDIDSTRHITGDKKVLTTETLSIDIKHGGIHSFDKKHKMMSQDQLRVVFKKF